MCGIAGLYRFESDSRDSDLVASMTDSLRHRGPDGYGVVSAGYVSFGHRRLSIIDLEGGRQPLWSHCGGVLISFNGEIYNYLELKRDLEFIGHKFQTSSDTEVIVELFKRWGVDSFKKLNGQFAFAIYDVSRRAMYLVRDLVGEKPLYYSVDRESVGFASELKGMAIYRRGLGSDIQLSATAFSEFLSLNYIAGAETGISGVVKVKPGHFIRCANGKVSEHQYASIDEVEGAEWSDTPTEDLSSLIRESVRLRLRSDVPVGLFLSGGVDSSVIAACAVKEGRDLKAFCADFKQESFSEVDQSARIAAKLGVDLHRVEIDINKIELEHIIPRLVEHGDEPLADSSALPVYLLSQATSNSVKVVLSGDGGDELFGGYLTYRATKLARLTPSPIRHILGAFAEVPYWVSASNRKVSLQEKLNRLLRNIRLPPAQAHFAWNGMFNLSQKINLVGERYKSLMSDTFASLADKFLSSTNDMPISSLLRADMLTYLPNDILAKVDRMSMAHGLEVRAPYLDPKIIQFSRLGSAKTPDFFARKRILTEVMRTSLGADLLPQKKLGFSIPVHAWFRGRLAPMFQSLLDSDDFATSGLFDKEAVCKLFNDHQLSRGNFGFELWGIMVMAIWHSRFFGSNQSVK